MLCRATKTRRCSIPTAPRQRHPKIWEPSPAVARRRAQEAATPDGDRAADREDDRAQGLLGRLVPGDLVVDPHVERALDHDDKTLREAFTGSQR